MSGMHIGQVQQFFLHFLPMPDAAPKKAFGNRSAKNLSAKGQNSQLGGLSQIAAYETEKTRDASRFHHRIFDSGSSDGDRSFRPPCETDPEGARACAELPHSGPGAVQSFPVF
jgi:hypothetical protein